MFPIPKECTSAFVKKNIGTYRTFKSEKAKSQYINLLDKELKVFNKMDLGTKALQLYHLKYTDPNNTVSKRCIDFKDMEKWAKLYSETLNNIEITEPSQEQ